MDNPYTKYPVTIHSITNETEDKNLKTFEIHFMAPEDSNQFISQSNFQAGQFAMLWVPGFGEIPLGIASSPTENDKLLFTVNKIGKVTRQLHLLDSGAMLGIRGPMGNGFPWHKFKNKDIVLIGGGYAFTTLRSSIVYMLDSANRASFGDIWAFYGARTSGMLLYKDELATWDARNDVTINISVDINNDPKWKHHTGNIPSVVTKVLPQATKHSVAIICGPPIMIKFALQALYKKGYESDQIFLSLENRMKCGIGHCGRCSIGNHCVCSDGPVFSMTEVEEMPFDY